MLNKIIEKKKYQTVSGRNIIGISPPPILMAGCPHFPQRISLIKHHARIADDRSIIILYIGHGNIIRHRLFYKQLKCRSYSFYFANIFISWNHHGVTFNVARYIYFVFDILNIQLSTLD